MFLPSKNDLPEGTIINIYNTAGIKVMDLKNGINNGTITVPLNISSGIYIVHLVNNQLNITKRFEKF